MCVFILHEQAFIASIFILCWYSLLFITSSLAKFPRLMQMLRWCWKGWLLFRISNTYLYDNNYVDSRLRWQWKSEVRQDTQSWDRRFQALVSSTYVNTGGKTAVHHSELVTTLKCNASWLLNYLSSSGFPWLH